MSYLYIYNHSIKTKSILQKNNWQHLLDRFGSNLEFQQPPEDSRGKQTLFPAQILFRNTIYFVSTLKTTHDLYCT